MFRALVIRGAHDAALLEWVLALSSSVERRLVLTREVSARIDFAWKRVASGKRHSGVSAVSRLTLPARGEGQSCSQVLAEFRHGIGASAAVSHGLSFEWAAQA